MKITHRALRGIIREAVRSMPEALLEIPNISENAEDMGMTVSELLEMIEGEVAKLSLKSIDFGAPEARAAQGYSKKLDTLLVYGLKRDLTALARSLDAIAMGGAQSISDEDSLVSFIEMI